MGDRTVSVTLRAQVADYMAKMGAAAASAKALSGELNDLGQKSPKKFNDVTLAAAGLGAALLGIVGYAVKANVEFDKHMSEVAAVSGATGKDLGKLRDAAIEAGKATMFSASQSAQAEAELSKAGISTADILGGALTGS